MLKISLKETLQRRMSDAEENPPEETQKGRGTEMKGGGGGEEDPNDLMADNMQQESEEEDTLAGKQSQEEEAAGEETEEQAQEAYEEEEVAGEETEEQAQEAYKEEEAAGEETEEQVEEAYEEEETEEQAQEAYKEEEVAGEETEEQAQEAYEEEEAAGEETEEQTQEAYKEEEVAGEETEEQVEEAYEEEETEEQAQEAYEEEEAAGEETEEQAQAAAEEVEAEEEIMEEQARAAAEEEEAARAQEDMRLERLMFTDSLLAVSAAFPRSRFSGDLSSQFESLDLDQSRSDKSWSSYPEKLPSGEIEETTSQKPEDEREQEQRVQEPRKGEWRKKRRVSYFKHEKKAFQSKAKVRKESLVSTTKEDGLFKKDDSASVYPLSMTWSFGWNSSLPVYYIRGETQRVLLYVCAHTVVIYDVFKNDQRHLQGHPNAISCLCISEDRRWIATADKGPDCLIIIWDSFSGIPVHTIFDSCPKDSGIRAIAITRDAKYLATISDAEVQQICIWKWTLAVEKPACTLDLNKEYGFQNYLTFNPTNNKELVSNSKTQAIYYSWQEERNVLVHSAPLLTGKTFNKLVGKFSQSVFHLNLTQLLSATMEGKLVVWDIHRPPPAASSHSGFPHIKPCKLVHLQKEGITVLTTVDSYIVTGDIKGNIKFYDHTLSIVNWYSQFKLSAIRTLSFSKIPPASPTEKSDYPPDCTLKGDSFIVRNFIIGTFDATVYHLTTDGTRLEKLFVEPKDAICAIACHPYQPLIAIGSLCGMIKVWDYNKKKYIFSRVFEKGLGVQSLTYNPEGALLGAGFTEGTVYILDAMSLENGSPQPFKYSRTNVTHISFSHDSQYMATADVSFTVAVYKVVVKNGHRIWEYLARLRSHRKSIQNLLFGVHLDNNEPRLLSLGKDRLLIEYNLLRSYKDHLEVLDIHRTDQGFYPTCMIWYPPLTREQFLLICTSGYKVKLFNSTTKMCRKTLLGPTFGSPIEHIQLLPVRTTSELQKRYLVFMNRDKVGLQILPVDGNPHKTTAIVCHPEGAAGMTLSYDGCYAFTAGGADRSVVQWKINLSALEAAVSLGGEDLTPFYGLVTGGREGKFYRELEDYFYYSQLRSQGIDTMETREVSEHICLSELPFVMRAIGFYPSEEKIEDMFNEVKFGEYVETGKIADKINLPDFLKIYINHRPPFGNTMSGIQHSFDVLGFTNSEGKKVIQRDDFLKLLLTKGEHMTQEEMSDCFATLFGLNPEGWKSEPATFSFKGSEICLEEELPKEITAEIFTTEILGLTISEDSEQDHTVSGV
ncbi:cilia- and flagella-associated protein 251 isoform X2 [Dasypus novemcinctus]|uniref:cilia- and flagella-associated protein 251 isoform X2 n=1 Tax=Dasypus novemcinctus TaxID=9361 RepID=UPI00265F6378|nr:cilia- and flagella-associated protein 251 isoform X2 [Dasypus novemcinctus]